MILAYLVKHHAKRLCQRITSVKDLSYYLWGCSLLIVSGTTMKNILHANTTVTFLLTIAACSLLLCLFQFACGRAIGSRFGQTINAGQALGQKNTAFAIWIACAYLTPLSSVGPGCYILLVACSLMIVSFVVQKLFGLIRSQMSISVFVANAFENLIINCFPRPMSRMVFF